MKEEQAEEMKKLIKKMERIFSIISYAFLLGDADKMLKFIEQEEKIIKQFQGDLPEKIKLLQTRWLGFRAVTYAYKGDLNLCLKDANELLRIGEFYDYERATSFGKQAFGWYYVHSGDLDKALEHLDRAIKVSEENLNDLLDFMFLADQVWYATKISIDKEDLERAKNYFKRLREVRELKPKEIFIHIPYRMAKAFLLKSSIRSRNRIMAEDILRKIIDNVASYMGYKLEALIGLCELLLVELKVTNDVNVVSEIKPLLEKLIEMAQQSGLHFYLIEAQILHGKLALIMFDMEGSRRHLTEAQQMAEKYGYIRLANEIAGLNKDMIDQKGRWEQMKKKDAPLSERMELARLEDHLKGKFRRLMMTMERAAEPPPKKEVF